MTAERLANIRTLVDYGLSPRAGKELLAEVDAFPQRLAEGELAAHRATAVVYELEVRTLKALLAEAAAFVEEFDQGECRIYDGYCHAHHADVPDGSPICEDGRQPDDLLHRIRAVLAKP